MAPSNKALVRTADMFLVIDDCESFRALLRLELGSDLTATAGSIADGLREAERLQPLVILLDNYFGFSTRTGIDAIPAFLAAAPRSTVILLTVDEDGADVTRALSAGAAAYVCKGDSGALWEALGSVAGVLRPRVTRRVVSSAAAGRSGRKVH